jgi:S-adenosylmethionine-diacylglycerol 3-amino-3-carboxypropyl transferase
LSPIAGTKRATALRLDAAVHHNHAFSFSGLRERMFTAAFQGMVYPQIWEDPDIDMEALAIKPQSHIVAIASGGCNIMSYLTADPGRITAVDLNHAHIALNRLKLAAARCLPSYSDFSDFFVRADLAANIARFDNYLAGRLDLESLRYWQGRDIFGRRRITAFARGFYRSGLLGRFIGFSHVMGKALGVDPSAITRARSLDEQRVFFEEKLAPLFDHWILRWVLRHPASLYGLGIPPAQYAALARGEELGMSAVLRKRVEKLACGFPLKENYFAHQAFGRGYDHQSQGALPPYLQEANFDHVRARANRVDVRHMSMTDFLASQPDQSVDGFVLLDAQDWMNTEQLTDLWRQIDRCATRDARVIFRTAAQERLLPGRIPDTILSSWAYHEAQSKSLGERDRSSIYGAFHLYSRAA